MQELEKIRIIRLSNLDMCADFPSVKYDCPRCEYFESEEM